MSHTRDCLQGFFSSSSQMQSVNSPVRIIRTAFDQTGCSNSSSINTNLLGNIPRRSAKACWLSPFWRLITPRIPACGGVNFKRSQALGKFRRSVSTNLGEHKSDSGSSGGWTHSHDWPTDPRNSWILWKPQLAVILESLPELRPRPAQATAFAQKIEVASPQALVQILLEGWQGFSPALRDGGLLCLKYRRWSAGLLSERLSEAL